MPYKKVAEVYVGPIVSKDKDGKLAASGSIRFGGRPILTGVYSPDNVPPGFNWTVFVDKAIKYDGQGLTVLYEGDERTGEALMVRAKKKMDKPKKPKVETKDVKRDGS